MLSYAGLGNVYWAETIATATYLCNRIRFPRGGTYRLEIISAPSKRVWSTFIAWFVLQIYRFCILLIGIE